MKQATKLTAEQITDLRTAYAEGAPVHALAANYRVNKRVINDHTTDIRRERRISMRQVIYKCPVCPMIFYDRHPRTYCTPTCREHAADLDRQHKFAEFEWIARTDTWANIAERLGYTSVKQLREWLRKHGHDAWADRINADVQMPRQGRWAA